MMLAGGKRGSPSHEVSRIPFAGAPQALPGKETVGSKAHNLMRIARCGLPVPPGFVFPAQLCRDFLKQGAAALEGIDEALTRELDHLGSVTGRIFGDDRRPLLVSVRSGAPVSMPGMMDTVLNIGLTPETLKGLLRMTGNPRLGEDCRCRLIQQYGEVVHGIPHACFAGRMRALLTDLAAADVDELGTGGLRKLAASFDQEFQARTGKSLPDNPMEQLKKAIAAVLKSWSVDRARTYRKLNGIPDELGTAITVQMMVFGNMGPDSGAGVGFTRNPANGSNELYVDYHVNAQGEDVVAGRRRAPEPGAMERRAPDAWRSLVEARGILEREFGDMQDFEFTVEQGRLLFLQCRTGKRTAFAALRIASDMVRENLISPSDALARLDGIDLEAIERTQLAPAPGMTPAARGTPAGIGVAVGAVVFDPQRIESVKRTNQTVILVREMADAGDVAALAGTAAYVTVEGARTSHAAVVANQLGKPCIVACRDISIDASARRASLGGAALNEGDLISIDGSTGEIFRGALEVIRTRPTELLDEVRLWRGRYFA